MDTAKPEDIKKCLDDAVAAFNNADTSLLYPRQDEKKEYVRSGYGWGGASERAIAHRLAVHLEAALTGSPLRGLGYISIDCEYNRHLGMGKVHTIPEKLIEIVEKAKRTVRPLSDDESFYVFSVAPDIIMHERGNDDHNLLVVELKKDSNHEIPAYDSLKLECFTAPEPGFDYVLGAKVTARDQRELQNRVLKVTAWFAHGELIAEYEK